MPLTTEQDSELDSLLGVASKPLPRPKLGAPASPRAPQPPKPSVDDELNAILSGAPRGEPAAPGAFDALKDMTPPGEALANLKNLPKLITEGIPKAAKTFWDTATSPEPTMGQELATAAPWLPIIPAVQDIVSRTGRGFSGLLKGGAELGPEQAKPLTEALLGAAAGGAGAPGALAETAGGAIPGVASAMRAARPFSRLPKVAPLPPEPPIGVAGTALPPGPPPRPMLPPREGRPALPETTSGLIPQGPAVEAPIPQGPIFKPPARPQTEADRLVAAREKGFGPRAARPELPPREIAGPALKGELLDAQGRPIQAPDVGLSEREKLRSLYRGRLSPREDLTGPGDTGKPFGTPEPWAPGEPPPPPGPEMPPGMPAPPTPGSPSPSGRPAADPGVFGLEMDKSKAPMPPPATAPTPSPELALRDYTAPGGTKVTQQIGDELVTWTKTDRNEWQGWVAGAHRKLTGESALNLAANPPAKVVGAGAPAPQPSVAAVPPPVAPPLPRDLPAAVSQPERQAQIDAAMAERARLAEARRAEIARLSEEQGLKDLPGRDADLERSYGPQAKDWRKGAPGEPNVLINPPVKSPAPPRFEATPEGMQGVIGGTPAPTMPRRALKAPVAQQAPESSPLFGQERAARSEATEGAQTRLEMGGRQQANVNEWVMDQLGGTYGIALTRAKSPEAIQPAVAAKLKSLGIDPVDAWQATHAEVPPPGVLDRLAGLSNPRQALAEGRAQIAADLDVGPPPKVKRSNPSAFQPKGDWETGVPNLSDPDDVFTVIQGAGKIRVGDDLAGELRGVPSLFKSKNGQSLDRIAEGLVESYPHLGGGDRAAVKEQLLDTMSRYVNLRRDKAAAKAKQGREFDVTATSPARQVSGEIAPEDTVMKGWADFLSDLGRDESGALNLGNFSKAWKKQREKLPMETAVIRDNPRSPVISAVERATARLADWTQARVNMPWHKAVRAADPEMMKDAEVKAIADWTANGKAPQAELAARRHFPAEVQAAMKQRDTLFDQANRSRQYFGLDPIKRTPGPYLPRVVEEGRDAVSLRSEGGGGASLRSTTPGGHAEKRAFESYRAGEAKGYEYEDPRNAILLRDWNDLKIRATHSLFKELEDKGVLFRNEASAAKVSPTGRPWKIEDAPGNTEWWAPTESEAKFLKQNLKEQGTGSFRSLVHYANATLRNPNLNNPFPHVVKNMAYKELLAQGPVSMARVARDAVELHRGTNPALIAEFNEAMPFAKSAQTAGESLNRGLIRPTLPGQVAQKAIEGAGILNAPSKKVIFEWADPAMRYSLWKHYREQGMDKYEAGNHAWVDLIRYGTRSDRTDFWKSMPLNFFVPWRFGTLVSLAKQVKNHPVRTALTVGAVEYIREAIHRQTGYWFHLPTDYAQKPLAAMAQSESLGEAGRNLASTALTTAFLGPGGDFSAKQIGEAMKLIGGDPHSFEWDRLRNAFWGISQLWNLQDEFKRGDYGGMLGTALVGAHRAYTYEPRRFTRDLPEWLPGMSKSAGVREAEDMRQTRKEKFERRQERQAERGKPPTIEDRLRAGGYIK